MATSSPTRPQQADGGIGTHGELLLSEVAKTSIFPQDGAPRPNDLLSTGYAALDRAPRAAAIAAAISCPGTDLPTLAMQKFSQLLEVFQTRSGATHIRRALK